MVNLHSKFAVTRLKSSVECADQSLHNGWLSRDDAKATLAACANRFYGSRLHVERDLSGVPKRNVDAYVRAMRVRAKE